MCVVAVLAFAPATGRAQSPDPDPAPASQGPRPDPAPQAPAASAPRRPRPRPRRRLRYRAHPPRHRRWRRRRDGHLGARGRAAHDHASDRAAGASRRAACAARGSEARATPRAPGAARRAPRAEAAAAASSPPTPQRPYARESGIAATGAVTAAPARSTGGGSADTRLILQLGMLFSLVYVAFLCVWFRATRHLRVDGGESAVALAGRQTREWWQRTFAGSGRDSRRGTPASVRGARPRRMPMPSGPARSPTSRGSCGSRP